VHLFFVFKLIKTTLVRFELKTFKNSSGFSAEHFGKNKGDLGAAAGNFPGNFRQTMWLTFFLIDERCCSKTNTDYVFYIPLL